MRNRTWARGVRRWVTGGLGGLLIGAGLVGASPVGAGPERTGFLGYDPADLGSTSAVTRIVGAQAAWAEGFTGRGVDVALLDSGVAPVAGLPPGQLINGPDLSFDGQNLSAPAGIDAFGHGTHLAGLIAGRDDGVANSPGGCDTCTGGSGYSDATKFVGVAPDARILNVKVGAYDGTVDVSQVIAAINWIIQHRNDNGMNVRVLNMSFGTQSAQVYTSDPLAYAVEQAWKAGILVVAAGGNDGEDTDRLADPAYHPMLLAVGAIDPNGTLERDDDTVPAFATHGNKKRGVDVVAPAVHLIGLNVPGSFVDLNYGASGAIGGVGGRFLRGSGTSQAAAVVSGVAALLYQKHPTATPDQMKKLITTTAFALPLENSHYRGKGIVDAAEAITAPLSGYANRSDAPSHGRGLLEASRGGDHLAVGEKVLTGEKDIFGQPWDSTAMAAASARHSTWTGGIWNTTRWTGDGWGIDGRWEPATWTSQSWAGTDWQDPSTDEQAWTGSRWTGSRWTGSRWTGSRWTGSRWTGSRWSNASWS